MERHFSLIAIESVLYLSKLEQAIDLKNETLIPQGPTLNTPPACTLKRQLAALVSKVWHPSSAT